MHPLNEVAYHVGAKQYTAIGQTFMGRDAQGRLLTPNYYLLGFELCVNRDGDFNKTYLNALYATVKVMHDYNLSIKHVWRHYDITGKDCPKIFLDEQKWRKLRQIFRRFMTQLTEQHPVIVHRKPALKK